MKTLLLGLLLAVLAASAGAGTICGTVRNGATSAPIAQAGIFVRTQAGAYTGLYAATDGAGTFCISNIPAGTYDVEVRVDDYQVAYLRGIEVAESTIGVDVPAQLPALAFANPVPNPARGKARLRWTTAADSKTTLTIYDARGRLLRAFTHASLPAGEHAFDWNLADGEGRAVPAGIYFIRLEAAGARQTRRLVVEP